MATGIAPVVGSVTPYSKVFILTGDGAEGVFPINDGIPGSPNCFFGALDPGPLRRTLLGAAAADVDHFNVDGARGDEIRIYDVRAVPADAAVANELPRRIRWVGNADPALAGLSCTLGVGDTVLIEVRLNHSTQA